MGVRTSLHIGFTFRAPAANGDDEWTITAIHDHDVDARCASVDGEKRFSRTSVETSAADLARASGAFRCER